MDRVFPAVIVNAEHSDAIEWEIVQRGRRTGKLIGREIFPIVDLDLRPTGKLVMPDKQDNCTVPCEPFTVSEFLTSKGIMFDAAQAAISGSESRLEVQRQEGLVTSGQDVDYLIVDRMTGNAMWRSKMGTAKVVG